MSIFECWLGRYIQNLQKMLTVYFLPNILSMKFARLLRTIVGQTVKLSFYVDTSCIFLQSSTFHLVFFLNFFTLGFKVDLQNLL